MENNQEKEVILRVKHLKQFFKMGHSKLKAVNDVSFDVYRGEVFGIVGESGCGKTTTGRSIIKLYDITSGDVIFKDQRVSAGTRWNEKEIKYTKIRLKAKLKELKEQMKEELSEKGDPLSDEIKLEVAERYDKEMERVRVEASEIISREKDRISKAKHDQKNGPKDYAAKKVSEVNDKYKPLLASTTDQEALKSLKKEYKDALRLAKRDRIMTKMQMIFQDPIASLDPRMTVREIIAEGLVIRGIRDQKLIDEKVYEVLEQVGLVKDHAGRYPHEFSGGQRQRIGIARAIIMDPDLIIADEPISALDVSIQAQIINLLNELREQRNLTIIFIAHNLSVVKYFCDRIAVMYFGKIVELATSEELFKHPLHPYTKSLLSAIPLPDPHYEKERQRISYNPLVAHDYSQQKPTLREILPGHFISANDEEFEKYKELVK
jgi:oligopeptide transport system ATP-binding protein